MQSIERFVGLGMAIVNEKIRKRGVVLPPRDDLVTFLDSLDRQTDTVRETGGVTPNIISYQLTLPLTILVY